MDDYAGTTISLTNPGGIGTVHSVPRLMPGQGTIIGVGAMEYPAAFAGMSEETLAQTRGQQDHHADHDLRPPDHPGRAVRRVPQGDARAAARRATASTTRSSRALRIPYEPVRWVRDVTFSSEGQIDKAARVIELIHAYRVRGHLMADTDPLEFHIRRHPDLDVLEHGLTLWDLDRTFPVGGFAGKQTMKLRDILGVLRDSYCRRVGVEYMHIQDPEERRWIQERIEVKHDQAGPRGAEARPRPAQRGRGVRDVPADQVRRPEAVLAGGRRVAHPAARRGAREAAAQDAGRGRHRHGAPRPAQRAGQHRRQAVREDLHRVRGPHRPEVERTAPAT